jgi:hypothetical protein
MKKNPSDSSLTPQEASPSTRESSRDKRVKKSRHAASKSLVHLPASSGGKIEFDDETRAKLLAALSRITPAPSQDRKDKMIDVARRVVSDLRIARRKLKEESQTAEEKRLIGNLLECAANMRDAWTSAFDNEQVRCAFNNRVLLGVIRSYKKRGESARNIYQRMRRISESDSFGRFNKKFSTDLENVIAVTSPIIGALKAAIRIKNYPDHSFTLLMAGMWLSIFETRPTFTHLDREEEGNLYGPSPFHSFVMALPLDIPISDEAIRSAVETVQEEVSKGVLGSKK